MERPIRVGRHIRALRLSAVLAIGAFFASPSYGQVAGATITGTVSDASGAVVPNAQIAIREVSTGIVRTVASDHAGFYMAPNLLPGNYAVTASAPGFSVAIQSGITLTVGGQQVLNITMQVGQVSQKVEVTSEAPTVQLADSTISAVVDSTTVRELPLNGRDWTQLATLQPGVTSVASLQISSGPGPTRDLIKGLGTQLAVAGTRPTQNDYRLDGISVNDNTNGGPGSALGLALGVDAIQEFSVLTSNYSAEYGRTSGGVINAVTRSGSNQFHGDAYEFLRNSALDARNYFDGPTIPEFRRNQFGGSIGGPIRKKKAFFFGDYEGLRQNLGITSVTTVPSPDARNGIIHNDDGTTTIVTVDPLVKPFLGLWGLPNGPLLAPGNTGIFTFVGSQLASENFGTARIDYTFSDQDTLFGSWQMDRGSISSPDSLNTSIQGTATSRQFVAIGETHIFSSQLVNSFRVGYNRAVSSTTAFNAINPLAADPSLGAVPGQNAPTINVPGLTGFTAGLPGSSVISYHWNSFQGYDDISLTKGIQNIKFGAAVERMDLNMFADSNGPGTFNFGSLTDFLTNQPSSFSAALPEAVSERGFRQTIFGLYVQDDIRWRPNLTINLGLRYEISSVPTEVQGKLTTLRDPYTDTTPHLGDPLFNNPTLRNFEPRVGFAWDPFRNGKTSFRGGFGMFDVLPLAYEIEQFEPSGAPFFNVVGANALAPGSFPTGAFQQAAASNLLRIPFIEPNPKRNYVMQWNLNIQREILPNLTATIAYVGNRGRHQPFRADDMNMVLPIALTPSGYLWPSPIGSGTVLNPNVGRIDYLSWTSNSSYDGLLVGVVKRMSHGLQVQGSFTWSKAIDEGSGSIQGDPLSNSISNLFFFDSRLRRALADFNVGRNLTVNFLWTIPTSTSLHGVTAWIARGWQLGSIVQLNSGLPFTPLFGSDGDPLGMGSHSPFDYPDRLSGPGCHSLVNPGNVANYIKLDCFTVPTAPSLAFYNANCDPTFGAYPECFNLLGNSRRNDLIGPGLVNVDFSTFKNNYIKENLNLQFRVEFFNIFNHSNFVSPIDNSTLIDSTGAPVPGAGLIDATSTDNREIQFALKLIW